MTPILELRNVTASYGRISALAETSFSIPERGIVTVVGPNGAGKTTLLNSVAGLLPAKGDILLRGELISRLSTERRLEMGLCLVSEKRELFPTMTVEDNLLLGAYTLYRRREDFRKTLDEVYTRFPRLIERRKQYAGTLSGGERQMLAIGRALMSKPKVLLLDEPSLGLSPKITKEVLATVRELREAGVSILLVEQNVRSALRISDYAHVLETGKITISGPAREVAQNSRVIGSYLGSTKAV